MVDLLSASRRSENMRRIRSRDMKPELVVRSMLHRLGYRFRLHAKDLPGKPDIVRRNQQQVIFVHGCFWHQHPKAGCLDSRLPRSNNSYWLPKLSGNILRDKRNIAKLRRAGWKVLVIWECEIQNKEKLQQQLLKFLKR